MHRDVGEWRRGGGIAPSGLSQGVRGGAGAEVSFRNSIIGNNMVYQDRLETNLLQPFGHPEIQN